MTEARVPFGAGQESSYAKLAGGTQVSHNVLVDGRGAIRRRPGMRARSGLVSTVVDADGITGLHVTTEGTTLAVGGTPNQRKVYLIGGGAAEIGILTGTHRPTFAETEGMVVIAGGAAPIKYEKSSGLVSALGGSPNSSSHVIANQSRLVMNRTDSTFDQLQFSDVATGGAIAGHEIWGGTGSSGFVNAEGKPDPVIALHENTNEVWAFGTSTVQIFVPDSTFRYAPVGAKEYGCRARSSIIKDDQSFAWLDDRRRFVMSDGRAIEDISQPIQSDLDALSAPEDCWGMRFDEGFADCLVWVFPTDRVGFAYQKGLGWSKWLGWGENWQALLANAHALTDGVNLIGTTTGLIGELSLEVATDFGDPVKADTITGHINRDTDMKKQCNSLRLTLERGSTSGSTSPVGWLSWSDENRGFGVRRPVFLGASGESTCVLHFRGLGVYRRRQWRFEFSGSEQLILANAVEDYEVLEE